MGVDASIHPCGVALRHIIWGVIMADEKFSNFLTDIIDADLAEGKVDVVHTRFPPEPNGYLHIGSRQGDLYINYTIAKHYGGLCNLRFDDTNPAQARSDEYVQSILQDLKLAGLLSRTAACSTAVDYFERCYEYAEQLIKEGKAYVDDLTREQMQRVPRQRRPASPAAPAPTATARRRKTLTCSAVCAHGEFADGAHTLRAKIDMASPNMNMRDPTIYRIKHVRRITARATSGASTRCTTSRTRSRTPSRASPFSSARLEYESHRPLYDWVVNSLFGKESADADRVCRA